MARLVLLVDDIATNREILKKILGGEYKYAEASDGLEALGIIRRDYKFISAVLLDLKMPVMDGYAVLEQMNLDASLAQIPVIVMTSNTDSESEEKALSIGASDYISKPYNATIVRQRLRNTINLRERAATINSLQRDRLTGLYSREAFFDRIPQLVNGHKPGYYTLSCFNIENFKVVNDQYGTDTGDAVLKHIAGCINRFTSAVGGLCGRIMADNFAILFPSSYRGTELVERTYKELLSPEGLGFSIGIRVGRYTVDDLSLSPSAMYDRGSLAERSIKGRFDTYSAEYSEDMRSEILHEQDIVNKMYGALQNREFEVWYQPQYNHSTGALIGAEALVRWNSPEKGIIAPGAFIPVFEQNGFIYELDKYVWEETCRCLREWIDAGRHPLPVSVNVSRYDIFRSDLLKSISDIIGKYRIPTDMLRLEITESAFAKSTNRIVEVVKELINLGFTIEIDDFGSGYSSLNTLRSVPAQIVKLDMKFLDDEGNSERGGNIIESVVRMTKWLGMSVIAEGVEEKSQADFLKTIGCNYVQGYLYGKPMTREAYEELCSKSPKDERLISLETVENLDNNTFWNPASMDTLIFNSYVGGACILEFHDGKADIIRSNDKYALEFGREAINANIYSEDILAEMTAESSAAFVSALRKTTDFGSEEVCEAEFNGVYGIKKNLFIRFTLRAIARASDRYLIYCTVINVTQRHEAERKRHTAAEQLRIIMRDVGTGITATVIENGKQEFLFSNDKYYEILGFTREQYKKEITDVYSIIHNYDRNYVYSGIMNTFLNRSASELRYRVIRRDGSVRYIKSLISTTSFSDVDSPVLLGIMSDITAERKAEQELRDTDEQLRFLNNVSHGLLEQADSGAGLNSILSKLLDYFSGRRAFIFELSEDDKFISCTYEVCAHGVTPIRDSLRNIPSEKLSYWIKQLNARDYINISDVEKIYEGLSHEDESGRIPDVSSVIAVPLRRNGKLLGFAGVCDREVHPRIDRLAAIGDYITVMLGRRNAIAEINEKSEQLDRFLNDMPGGFMRSIIGEGESITPVFINDGFLRLVDTERSELTAMFDEHKFTGIYPDDIEGVKNDIHSVIVSGSGYSSPHRMKHGKEGYIWVMFFGSVTRDEKNTYLNLYYTDISGKKREEEKQKELLDNLPYGVSLFEYDGKRLRAIHINKRYWELVGRNAPEEGCADALVSIHPDDRAGILDEIDSAIRNKRDININIRIIDGNGGYRPFCNFGRVILNPDGKYSIYSTYTPISGDGMSYRDMLPVVLSAIMQSGSELSFAKDKNFRYICASRSFLRMVGIKNGGDIIGKTDYDLFEKEVADKYRADDERLISDGVSITDMTEIIPSVDGIQHYSSTSKFLLRDIGGNIIGLYGTGRDITEYRSTFDKLKLFTDSVRSGLATYICRGEVITPVYYNEAFYDMLDYTRGEIEERVKAFPLFMVHPDDINIIGDCMLKLRGGGDSADGTFRVKTKTGNIRWVKLKGTVSDRSADSMTVNAVFLDITEQINAIEKLRLNEEEYNVALAQAGNLMCRYDISTHTAYIPAKAAERLSIPEKVENMPDSPVKLGYVSADTAGEFKKMFYDIENGHKEGSCVFRQKTEEGYRWFEARFNTLFTDSGKAYSAVLIFNDVNDTREKEAVFKRWQQSLQDKKEDDYTLFRCNLSRDSSYDTVEGTLLKVKFKPGAASFNERTDEYADSYVAEEDREKYRAFMNSDSLLAGYYRGKRSDKLEYREMLPNGGERWLSVSVDLIEYRDSTEVEAFLMYENIDRDKLEQLEMKRLTELDQLTGILNRSSFREKANNVMSKKSEKRHGVLLMFDIDGFKLVNDVFGHTAGDEVLCDIANAVGKKLRRSDLFGRLGGDEFVIYMRNIDNRVDAGEKALQICDTVRRSYGVEVQTSASIGIAVYPEDGTDFDTLYRKADIAMYHVKATGKDNYEFYNGRMNNPSGGGSKGAEEEKKKRRMLIVDDNKLNRDMLVNMFKDEFEIETSDSGSDALIRMRRCGQGISVVLLDLVMPGLDGFAVLDKMKASEEMRFIPVIIVSGLDERKTSLRAIKGGASDYVTKPIDADLLRLRVSSAVSKSENERLRAQNRMLTVQNDEFSKYRAVLKDIRTGIIEYDASDGSFKYDKSLPMYLAGVFDDRALWTILRDDGVARREDIERIRGMSEKLLQNARQADTSLTAKMKTPSGETHAFNIRMIRLHGDSGEKLLITVADSERK